MFFFLDPLEGSMSSSKRSTQLGQLTAVFKIFGDWRTLCLVPYVLYTLVQMSFMFGEYTKVISLLFLLLSFLVNVVLDIVNTYISTLGLKKGGM